VKLGKAPDGTFVGRPRRQDPGRGQRSQEADQGHGRGRRRRRRDQPAAGPGPSRQGPEVRHGGDARRLERPAEPETGDKYTRAEPFSAQCEAGNVFIVEGEWNNDYLDELCLFPGGSFKDQVDASSGAFGRLVMKKQAPTAQTGATRRN
jgi:hypothetical protein